MNGHMRPPQHYRGEFVMRAIVPLSLGAGGIPNEALMLHSAAMPQMRLAGARLSTHKPRVPEASSDAECGSKTLPRPADPF